MSTIEQFAAAVPAYLGFYEDKSPCTQELKVYALNFFIDYMSKEHPGQEITPDMVLGYRRSLYGLEANTIAQYMRQVRCAYKFMLEAKLITGENPVSTLFVGREKYKPYDSLLSDADLQRIFRDECPEVMNGRVYLRARAMVLVCLSSGVRLAELLALTPDDLDWEGERAIVRRGKGDKWRVVPFPRLAQQAVKKYMDLIRKGCPEGMPLFVMVTKAGAFKTLNPRTAQKNINSYVDAMTGRKDISPHDLRHSMASHLVSLGMNMREVQTLLGHANINITERYAQLVAPDTAPVRSANAVMNVAFGRPALT